MRTKTTLLSVALIVSGLLVTTLTMTSTALASRNQTGWHLPSSVKLKPGYWPGYTPGYHPWQK